MEQVEALCASTKLLTRRQTLDKTVPWQVLPEWIETVPVHWRQQWKDLAKGIVAQRVYSCHSSSAAAAPRRSAGLDQPGALDFPSYAPAGAVITDSVSFAQSLPSPKAICAAARHAVGKHCDPAVCQRSRPCMDMLVMRNA